MEKISKIVDLIFSNTMSLCFLTMVVGVTLDTAVRNFSGSELEGTVEISEFLLVVVGFLGMVVAHNNKSHMRIGISFFKKYSSRGRYFSEQINNIILLIFFVLFFYGGFQKAISSYKTNESAYLGSRIEPVWFFRWVVPLSCVFLCLQILADIWRLRNKRHLPDKE